jgi:DNA modification methylase
MAKVKKQKTASHMRHQLPKELCQLKRLFQTESMNKFAIGDEISKLVSKDWLVTDLAQTFNRKRNRLSEIYHTAQTFGPDLRDSSIPFSLYELARIGVAKFGYTPQKALKLIRSKGINQRRDAMRYFAMLDMAKRNRKSAFTARNQSYGQSIINQCHHMDCRILAQQIPNQSIKIIFFDAPYGRYGKYKEGQHNLDSAALSQCDNADTDDVIELIDDMFRISIDKLTTGGVLLLCRPGGIADPLHNQIITSAEAHDWDISNIITWDKGKVQLGDRSSPYQIDTETIWALHRKGDRLENHNGSLTKTVLRFDPVRQQSLTATDSHLFIKPLNLCKFLISKHSFEGELVFDACGCSGNFCIAAHQLNRKFIYSETNADNYELGSRRINEAIQSSQLNSG